MRPDAGKDRIQKPGSGRNSLPAAEKERNNNTGGGGRRRRREKPPEIPPAKALSPWFEKCRLGDSGWNAPSIDDLNGDTEREFDQTGVRNTTEEDLVRLEPETGVGPEVARLDGARLQELGIRRMMVVDARGDREPEERRE